MDPEDEIIEGEITSGTVVDNGQAAALLSLEELIKNHIDSVVKLRIELKKVREMFDDSFESNPTFRELSEAAAEGVKKKLQLKQQISKQPSVASLAQKMKDFRFDLSEQGKTLSALLEDYRTQTGATQIETHSGEMMDIVTSAKLVKRSSK